MSPQKKMDHGRLGFGTQVPTTNPNRYLADQHYARAIPASGSKRIYMKLDLSGLFFPASLGAFIRLGRPRLTNPTLQLSLAQAVQAMIISDNGATYSQNYTLADIRLLSDMCSLSGELQESYNAAFLSGASLKMPIKSWEALANYLPSDSSDSLDVAISKNYTQMSVLFATFDQSPPADNGGKAKLVNTNYFP